MFELEEDWDDRESSGSENLHDALFVNEDAPLLEQLKRSPGRNSLQEATNSVPTCSAECGHAAKKSRSEYGVSVTMSPKKYSLLHNKSSQEQQSPTSAAGLKGMLHKKMSSKISGARFRWINEQLYTKTGEAAKDMFEQDPSLFGVYHKGFAAQVSKWPLNPLDRIISYVLNLPSSAVVADFGCGEAKMAQHVPNTVYSFDFVAVNSHVTPCDMANVPLSNSSVDVAVFCLSLMGTNISEFIREARRVLKKDGRLKICEIASRFASEDEFSSQVERFGFELVSKESFSTLFLDFEFRAYTRKRSSTSAKMPDIVLKPCIYKRR